ncbi:MAG: capsular biosynthesis protein, partial [Pseudomonadota bacterium]
VEQGYIRPAYLTLEPDGTGGRTRFPGDWAGIETLAAGRTPPAPQRFETSFFGYAAMDVAFNLANVAASWLFFPHYKQHGIDHPTREWSGWIVNKILPLRRRRRQLAEAETSLAAHEGPVFILPLQLETDYQIRLHAPPGGVKGMLERAIASFAANAPADAALVVKIHPLDHGWTNWRAMAKAAAAKAGVRDRVIFFDGGDLDAMLARCAGVVVANSTVGLTALQAGAPVIAVGKAIYDLPGLTFAGDLDAFWTNAAPPDRERVETFLAALGAIQTPGGFDGEGALVGAENVADMILADPPY